MFLDLLSLTAGVTVFVAAFMEGRKAGALGVSVGLVLGLAIGFGVAWGTRVALKWAVWRLGLHEAKLPPLRLVLAWVVCLAALVVIVASGISVSLLTREVIHLLEWKQGWRG